MSTGEQGGSGPQPIAPAKFWLKSALVIVVAGILLAWAWMPSRPEEPVYQDKTMREWLKAYVVSDSGTEAHSQSMAALRKIGTNGIPTLLRMIQTSDSSLKVKLQAFAEKQRFIKSNFEDPKVMRNLADWGFYVLGENAKGAIPELLTLAKKPNGTEGRGHGIIALGYIGPSAKAAVPVLLAIASDATDRDKGDAIRALGFIHSYPESVVPFLESCLTDPVEVFRARAADALSKYGEAAKSSVPALITMLADPSAYVRHYSTNALKRIDSGAAAKAGIP